MKLSFKIILASALLLIIGIAYAQTTKPPAAQITSGTNGRYQIVMNPISGTFTFLLDTQTGKVWQWTEFSDLEDNPKAWMVKPRLDSTDEMVRWARTQVAKTQP